MDLAVDPNLNVYVTGVTTDSSNVPEVWGTLKYTGSGTVSWGPVYEYGATGTSKLNRPTDIAVDASGNAYLTGTTDSSDFPVRNAYQPRLKGRTRHL